MPVVARAPGELAFQGTHILAFGAMRELAERYAATGGRRLLVNGGGCDDGIVAVRRGAADFGGLCCPVKGSSAEGIPWLPVATDVKAVIVHPDNPLRRIGLDDLRHLATGRIARWSTQGWTDRPVVLVIRKHCPDYLEPVRDILLANRPDWSPKGLFVDTDRQIVDLVARFPGAVGIVSWVFVREMAAAGKLKALALDGVTPEDALREGKAYRLSGPLNIVFRAWQPRVMTPFFDFLYGPAGQAVISQALIPVSAAAAGYRPRGRLMQSA